MKSSEILLCVCLLSVFTSQAYSYVLLQVSKDEQNRSNVDALIHKVLPSEQYDKLVEKIARKRLSSLHDEKESKPIFNSRDVSKEVRSVVKSRELAEGKNSTNIMKRIKEMFDAKPVLRTNTFQIAPEVINFRSGKESLLYRVSSDSIVQALNDVLSSKTAAQYADKIGRRAAAIYQVIKE